MKRSALIHLSEEWGIVHVPKSNWIDLACLQCDNPLRGYNKAKKSEIHLFTPICHEIPDWVERMYRMYCMTGQIKL